MNTGATSENRKWLLLSLAIVCGLVAFVVWSFLSVLGDWLELEAKLSLFPVLIQFAAAAIGAVIFIVVLKNSKSSMFLDEVYQELQKVVWPNGQENIKHTVGIIIGVTIVGFFLGIFDFAISKLLNFIYN